jgi:hypothetical protein
MFKKSINKVPDRPASGTPSSGPNAEPVIKGGNGPHARRIVIKLVATAAVLGGCALLASNATWSNLNATVTNPSNSFSAGTVQIASNSATAAVTLTNGKPGSVATGCIQVSYTGTLPANVKLYGTGGGTGLNQYLTLIVTRGSFSGTPASGSCTGFTADATNYISQGAGVIYDGTVGNWPATTAAALVDPTATSPATWATGNAHGYEFQVTLQTNAAAQGLTGSESFVFEADNT